jgi:hypothetical protein
MIRQDVSQLFLDFNKINAQAGFIQLGHSDFTPPEKYVHGAFRISLVFPEVMGSREFYL